MKIACIYHRIDLDGWMSAAIVKYWWENSPNAIDNNDDKLDFIGYNYGDPVPDLSEYDKVTMCDISFPKDEMNDLHWKLRDNFIWLDHHISAITDSLEYSYSKCEGLRLTSFAACELTWKYFFPNEPMPEIVRLLGRYDCSGHKNTDEETKVLEFQYGARQCISNYEDAYKYLIESLEPTSGIVEDIQYNGASIYQYLCTEAKQTYKNGFEIGLGQSPHKWVDISTLPDLEPETLKNAPGTFVPYRFICINKERFNPINFGIDYHKDGYDGAACFHYANGMWNFSLYNDNGEVDCSVIAKQFGGGGHKGASGFRLNNEEFIKLINGR